MLRPVLKTAQYWLHPATRLSIPVAVVALCLAAAAPQPAHANDNKAYPGSGCHAFGGDPDIETGGGIAGNAAVINVNGALDRTVICPVVRDNTININGTGNVWVYVNRSAVAVSSLSCTFYSTAASFGGTIFSVTRSTSAVGNVKLDFAVPNSSAGGPYSITCRLPPLSMVYAYLVPEY